MSIDYKEYSRQRDIAVKRIKRLEASGVKLDVYIPTVKEVRSKEDYEQSRLFSALSGFLESGLSLSRRREERTKASKEWRAEQRRQYQRGYRRQKVAEKYERPNVPNKYRGYLKGLKKLGVDLKPSQLPGFFKYMDYRFAQGNASRKYVFDIFVDDYQELLQKGYKPDQILADYEKFEADQIALGERAGGMNGYTVEQAISSWDKYIGR